MTCAHGAYTVCGVGEPDILLTPKQAARILGVHPDTLWRWGQQGIVEYSTTPGRHRRYSKAHIEGLYANPPSRDRPNPPSPTGTVETDPSPQRPPVRATWSRPSIHNEPGTKP